MARGPSAMFWMSVLAGASTAYAEPPPSALALALRPDALQAAQARLGEIGALPSYELALDLDPHAGRLKVEETLRFVHRGAQPLRELLLMVYANTAGARRSDGSEAMQLTGGRCVEARASAREPDQAARASAREPDQPARAGAREPDQAARADAREPDQTARDLAQLSCRVTQEARGVLRVRFAQPVQQDAEVRVALALSGELPRIEPERTGLSGQLLESLQAMQSAEARDFGLLSLSDGVASLAGFWAVLAPRGELPDLHPIGDQTSDELANVSARVRVPQGVEIASVGVVVERRELAAGAREYVIEAPLVRDFALSASDRFVHVERQHDGVRLRALLLPESRAQAERVLDAAAQALSTFSLAFTPYPYRELELAEAPLVGGVGGVEFSGFVSIARMLLDDGATGAGAMLGKLSELMGSGQQLLSRADQLDMVIAHEVAHQWWHVLIGSDSRRHPFVDEGLAQWSALYFMERCRGSGAARRAQRQLATSYQMMRLMGEADAAVARPTREFRTPLAYGGLVYGKGPFFYVELRRALGDRRFFQALSSYAARYAFSSAPPHGFSAVARESGDEKTIRALERRWLLQARGDQDLGKFALGVPNAAQGKPSLGVKQLTDLLGKLLEQQGGAANMSGLLRDLLEGTRGK